jgi:hypothetical protein
MKLLDHPYTDTVRFTTQKARNYDGTRNQVSERAEVHQQG